MEGKDRIQVHFEDLPEFVKNAKISPGVELPISMDTIQKNREIPQMIAELSYKDEKQSIHFIRLWGEKRTTITEIHSQLRKALNSIK